jgi:hypothetical protein
MIKFIIPKEELQISGEYTEIYKEEFLNIFKRKFEKTDEDLFYSENLIGYASITSNPDSDYEYFIIEKLEEGFNKIKMTTDKTVKEQIVNINMIAIIQKEIIQNIKIVVVGDEDVGKVFFYNNIKDKFYNYISSRRISEFQYKRKQSREL